jgi:hypothetical protein
MQGILDLYTDYLLSSFGPTTATGLSKAIDGAVSHDKITRLLSEKALTSRDLWREVKPLVREFESDTACLIFDDTLIEKPYTDENEIIGWFYDHSENRNKKGINLLTAFYHSQKQGDDLPLRIPVAFECVKKDVSYTDSKTGKIKRTSSITKNELMQQMIKQCIRNQLRFKYVLADSWFASSDNMLFIHHKNKFFVMDIKSNRLIALSQKDRSAGNWIRLDELNIDPNTPVKVFMKDLEIQVLLCKQIFKNKDGSTGEMYLVTNNLRLSSDDFETFYKKRWGVEEYHKSIKQNTGAEKSPTRTERTQQNHLFASMLAYVKLEKLKSANKMNHFALKSKLYLAAIKAAFKELYTLKNVDYCENYILA